MSAITHHIPDDMLAAYAAGILLHVFSVVVASHVSPCRDCQAGLLAHRAVGGAVLEQTGAVAMFANARQDMLDQLDEPYTPTPRV